MIDLKEFRKVNNLTQTELGDYLGIKKSFISKIESGIVNLPKDKLKKLLCNSNGWDTSALEATHIENNITAKASGNAQATNNVHYASDDNMKIAVLEERIKYLEILVAEKERLISILMDKH